MYLIVLLLLGLIYRVIFPNGKSYIGLTKNSWKTRWSWHKAKMHETSGGCRRFYKALRKYGIDKVKHEILMECTDDKLDEYETFYINKYDTLYRKGGNGYNLTTGGRSGSSYSEESRKKIGAVNRGKKRTEDAKNKMSTVHIGQSFDRPRAEPDLPKYTKHHKNMLGEIDYYCIQYHPMCNFKRFPINVNCTKEEAKAQAIAFAQLLIPENFNADFMITHKILPKYVSYDKTTKKFKVSIRGRHEQEFVDLNPAIIYVKKLRENPPEQLIEPKKNV